MRCLKPPSTIGQLTDGGVARKSPRSGGVGAAGKAVPGVLAGSPAPIAPLVEADRRFENLESSKGCTRFSIFRGWLAHAVNNDKILRTTVGLTDCDFKEAEFTTPMGLLELKEGLFAVVQVNGWESQSYAILKIGAAEVTTVLDSPVR